MFVLQEFDVDQWRDRHWPESPSFWQYRSLMLVSVDEVIE